MNCSIPLSDNLNQRNAQAAARNAGVILNELKKILPTTGAVLEVGSGTGQHGAAFSRALWPLRWIPSDVDDSNFNSIKAWNQTAGKHCPTEPRVVDARARQWNVRDDEKIIAIVAINVIHISSWDTTEGILTAASRILPTNGILFFYGPFFRDNIEAAESNLAFDAQLKKQNNDWGLRNLDLISRLSKNLGLDRDKIVSMPKNNLCVVFRKRKTQIDTESNGSKAY
ncbi:MAG: SAM-dependent methyltransferase [Rhodospirillaceae bacterium]|nr:SAM-dependent methyltransferase [Rhodospirillaceae bacterium]|tara:strand:+ start:664 stop:1341 length:678 start_codon:yes stop_codon:yes gene_type:complete